MNRILQGVVFTAFAIATTASCSEKSSDITGVALDDPTANDLRVYSAAVTLADTVIPVGRQTQARATLYDRYHHRLYLNVLWRSSDSTIATVSADGMVTGIAPGAASITAIRGYTSGSAALSVTGVAPPPSGSGTPGTVTDLKSVATDTSSVTLSFTQVDDGLGQPAKYDIRYAASPISWGDATSVTAGTCSTPVSGTSIGAALTCTVQGLNPSTAYGFQLVAFRGTMNQGAVYGALSNAISATTAASGSPPPPPPPPPAPVASVSVSPSSATLDIGATTQLTAQTRDANNNLLSGRAVAWTSSNTAVATVSSNGLVTAVAAGTSQVTATSEGKAGTAAITVNTASAPPPPPPDGSSAEPAGFNVITDRPFNSTTATYTYGESGWQDWNGTTALTIIQDATAPHSPSNVARLRYPAGYAGGDAPGGGEYNLHTGGRSANTIYIAMWVKLSSNWYGNPSGVNKLYHVWVSGVNRLVASATGEASNPLVPQIRLQGLGGLYSDGTNPPAEDVNLNPNVAGQTSIKFVRGQWYKWEVVTSAGTPGGANGTIDWWINGVHVGHYTGIPYVPPGGSASWEIFKWDPTWGGIGGTVPADQFMYVDHIRISGN